MTNDKRSFYYLVATEGHEQDAHDGVFFADRIDAVQRHECTVTILYASGQERKIVSSTPTAARLVFDSFFEACTGGKTISRQRS